MNLLTLDVKKKIKEVTEEVANKVGNISFVIILSENGNFGGFLAVRAACRSSQAKDWTCATAVTVQDP